MATPNRSCRYYLHRDNTVREVTMPWDSPVNFRNIRSWHLSLALQSWQNANLWDRRHLRFNEDRKRITGAFVFHIKKSNYHLQEFLWVDVTSKSPLHYHFSEVKTIELWIEIWCDVWWKQVDVCASSLQETHRAVFLIWSAKGSEGQKYLSLSGSPVLLWQTDST